MEDFIHNNIGKIFVLCVIIFLVLAVFVLKSQDERLDRHNKYQCAVYGYQEDCSTPLLVEDRLK